MVSLEVYYGHAEIVDRWGNMITFSTADVDPSITAEDSRWRVCQFCNEQVTVFRVLRNLNHHIVFTKCQCEANFWPLVVKKGIPIGELSVPFASSYFFDAHAEQPFNTKVWSNPFILAYLEKGSRKLVAFKWSAIKEGDYGPLDFSGIKKLGQGNVADCLLAEYKISVLWQNGNFILPGVEGKLSGSSH